MYEIFEIRGNHAFPSTHALLTEPYKSIWHSDTSEGKEEAIRIFTYIELMCSPKKSNKFYGIGEEKRGSAVKKEVWKDENYPTTSDMLKGCIAYREDLKTFSPTFDTLEAAIGTGEALKKYYKAIDLNKTTTSGALVYKAKDVQASLEGLDKTLSGLEGLRAKVLEELGGSSKTMSNREPGAYED